MNELGITKKMVVIGDVIICYYYFLTILMVSNFWGKICGLRLNFCFQRSATPMGFLWTCSAQKPEVVLLRTGPGVEGLGKFGFTDWWAFWVLP